KNHFQATHPELLIPGTFYAGYMDMSYFAIVPEKLKERGLKIAVVYLHEACRFEVWLSAANKKIQARYWELITFSGSLRYRLVPGSKAYASILAAVLTYAPDITTLPA